MIPSFTGNTDITINDYKPNGRDLDVDFNLGGSKYGES